MDSKSTATLNGKEVCLSEAVNDLVKNLEVAKNLVENFAGKNDQKHFKQVFELLSENEGNIVSLNQEHDILVLASYYSFSLSRVIELLYIEYEEVKNKNRVKLFLAK